MNQDIKINQAGDIALDVAGIAVYINDLESISQDIKHLVLESQLLTLLIANNNPNHKKMIFNRLKILIENDMRIIPASTRIIQKKQSNQTKIIITAQSDLGEFSFEV